MWQEKLRQKYPILKFKCSIVWYWITAMPPLSPSAPPFWVKSPFEAGARQLWCTWSFHCRAAGSVSQTCVRFCRLPLPELSGQTHTWVMGDAAYFGADCFLRRIIPGLGEGTLKVIFRLTSYDSSLIIVHRKFANQEQCLINWIGQCSIFRRILKEFRIIFKNW